MKRIAEFLNADILEYGANADGYDVIVARMASGIVIRKLCKRLKSKYEDPAVVLLDPTLSYAIPILGGHEGANEVALKLEKIGFKAIITTTAEFDDRYAVGVGFRRDSKAEEIVEAILKALKEINAEARDVKILATSEVKKRSFEFRKAAKMLGIPAGFVSNETINSMDVRKTKAEIIGVKNVCEACAIFYSKRKELILPKTVFGGVTIAIAR
ncbi:MAG: cobalamin biosynthesis protein [Archaeoglobaceae archaeon]